MANYASIIYVNFRQYLITQFGDTSNFKLRWGRLRSQCVTYRDRSQSARPVEGGQGIVYRRLQGGREGLAAGHVVIFYCDFILNIYIHGRFRGNS